MKRSMIVLILTVTFVGLIACSTTPKGAVQESSQMKPSQFMPNVMVYRNPDMDITQYSKIVLSPVEIYSGPDASYSGMSSAEQKRIADYLYSAMLQKLQQNNLLAPYSGPNTARLMLIFAGAEKTRPVATTVTYLLPVGMVMNIGKGAMGKSGTFMGSATVGGEFTDSVTGTLLASFLTREAPNAMDVAVIVGEWDATLKAMDKIAEEVSNRLAKMRSGGK